MAHNMTDHTELYAVLRDAAPAKSVIEENCENSHSCLFSDVINGHTGIKCYYLAMVFPP